MNPLIPGCLGMPFVPISMPNGDSIIRIMRRNDLWEPDASWHRAGVSSHELQEQPEKGNSV